jgi:hypothetical protein
MLKVTHAAFNYDFVHVGNHVFINMSDNKRYTVKDINDSMHYVTLIPVEGETMIKQSTLDSIKRYVDDRVKPGGFLMAVLSNDLCEAFSRADDDNAKAMHEIVRYIYNEIPSSAWGSPEKVYAWLHPKGDK